MKNILCNGNGIMMYVKVMKISIDLLKLFISFKTILWDVAQNA